MHQYGQSNQSGDQQSSIPSIIRNRKSPALKSRGESSFYGILDERKGYAISLKFIQEAGTQRAIHYHDIISPIDFDGNEEITISTSRLMVTIKGKNLGDLFDHIIQHRVMWVSEPQGSFSSPEEGEVEIEEFQFEGL